MTSDSKIGEECKNSHFACPSLNCYRKWRRCHLVRFPNPLAFLKSGGGDLVYQTTGGQLCTGVTLQPMSCTITMQEYLQTVSPCDLCLALCTEEKSNLGFLIIYSNISSNILDVIFIWTRLLFFNPLQEFCTESTAKRTIAMVKVSSPLVGHQKIY